MKGRLLLDVVVRKGAAVLELLAGEDKTLLVWGDALLVLDPVGTSAPVRQHKWAGGSTYLALTLSIVSEDSTSRVMAEGRRDRQCGARANAGRRQDALLPVRVLTKICMVLREREGRTGQMRVLRCACWARCLVRVRRPGRPRVPTPGLIQPSLVSKFWPVRPVRRPMRLAR